jgi:hypothetical protein
LSDQPIYINYSEDVRQALAAADVDMPQLIRDELERENIPAEVSLATDPINPTNTDREVFLVILASGVAVSLIGSAVARVIDAVTKRERAAMVEQEIKVATGPDGKPLLDMGGKPLHNTTSKPIAFPSSGKEETSFTAFKLLTYKFSRS